MTGKGSDVPSVAVIVPAHRPSEAFDRCLDAIGRLDPKPAEVIVVVDGGDRTTVERARAAGAHVVAQHPRAGPAVARNSGVARATSDIVLFLDSDVEAAPDVVGRVARAFAAEPELAAVIGSYDDHPREPNLASQYKNLLNHRVHQLAREDGFTFWGACGAIRRDVFCQVGGFDEEYVAPSIEDIELGSRLRDAGYPIRVDKDLQVTHLKRWTPWSLLKTDVVHRALPWSALILRTGRMEDDLNVGWLERIKSGLTVLATLALLASVRWREAGLVAGAALATVVVLDLPFLRFLATRGGPRLALWGAGWHLLYHLYAAVGYAAALLRHVVFGPHPLHEPWPGSPRRWHGDGPAPAIVSGGPAGVRDLGRLPTPGRRPATSLARSGIAPPSPSRQPAARGAGVITSVDPATARVETRISHAAAAVPISRLLRRSRRLRLWAPLVLLVAIGVLLLPHFRTGIHVDGLAYLRIAQDYAAGRFDQAVNPFWGPLYSWLLAPLLFLGIEPLLATKVLQLALGAATLLAIRRLCLVCGVRTATADGMALVTIPLVVYFVYLNVFADLLVALLLVLFCCELVPARAVGTAGARRRPVRAGLWAGLAFLAKPYALPVVAVSVVVVHAVRWWAARRERSADGPPAGVEVRDAAITLGVLALTVAPWIVVLSLHTGSFTISHSVGYNLAILAPGSTGQPLANGLVDPPHADGLFAWRNPSTMPVESTGWTASPEAGPRLWTNVADNVRSGLAVAASQFLPVAVLASLGGYWMLRNTRGQRAGSPWTALLVVATVYTGGYVLTLVEGRYLWFTVLAVLPLAASAIDAPYLRPSLDRRDADFASWRLAGFAVFAAALSVEAAVSLPWSSPGQEVADLAAEARAAAPAGGENPLEGSRVASDGDWEGSSILCFHLGCSYLGVVDPADRQAWQEHDVSRRADHYVAWGGHDPDRPDALGEPVLEVGPLAVYALSPAGR